MMSAIKLPSAPESTLYIMQGHLWLMLDSNLVNERDFKLSRLIYFAPTTSKLLSCSTGTNIHELSYWLHSWTVFLPHQSCCCPHVNLQAALKWFYLPHHFLAMHRTLPRWVPHTTGFASFHLFCTLGAMRSYICILHLIMSNSFSSFMSFSVDFCANCASTLHSHDKTH